MQSQVVNLCFDSALQFNRQLKKDGVKIAGINLQCGFHSPESGWRTRE